VTKHDNAPNIVTAKLHQYFALKSFCNTFFCLFEVGTYLLIYAIYGHVQCHQRSNEMENINVTKLAQDITDERSPCTISLNLVDDKTPLSNLQWPMIK